MLWLLINGKLIPIEKLWPFEGKIEYRIIYKTESPWLYGRRYFELEGNEIMNNSDL